MSPVVAVLPDLFGAVIAHCRAHPNLSPLVGTRVSTRLRLKTKDDAGWGPLTDAAGVAYMPHAIVFQGIGQVPSESLKSVQMRSQLVHALCYGPTMLEAGLVWRTLEPALAPDPDGPSGFVAAGCRVWQVNVASGPTQSPDPATGYARVAGSFEFIYGALPA